MNRPRAMLTAAARPRVSLWLMAAAMVFVVALKPDRVDWPHFALLGWAAMAAALVLAARHSDRRWLKTCVLFAGTIILLRVTAIDGVTDNAHVLELAIKLGIGILLLPALATKWWLKEPLDYSWWNGRWSRRMLLWLPGALVLAWVVMHFYFNHWTPELHHSWPLPPDGSPQQITEMWRLFWGCNLVGVWDELAFINFVFVLLLRHFSFREANLAQAIFFTSFLYDMAFVGWGPVVIFTFALVQGFTYERTRSLLYIILLHLLIDTVLFFHIANRWYPGWGWHPW